jgi:hypothetical protein
VPANVVHITHRGNSRYISPAKPDQASRSSLMSRNSDPIEGNEYPFEFLQRISVASSCALGLGFKRRRNVFDRPPPSWPLPFCETRSLYTDHPWKVNRDVLMRT